MASNSGSDMHQATLDVFPVQVGILHAVFPYLTSLNLAHAAEIHNLHILRSAHISMKSESNGAVSGF